MKSKLLVCYEVYIQCYQKAMLSLEKISNESEDVRNIIDNANVFYFLIQFLIVQNNPIFNSSCDLSLPARHILQYPLILKV